jgi:putative oxidoreductase
MTAGFCRISASAVDFLNLETDMNLNTCATWLLRNIFGLLNRAGEWFAPLGLRLLLAYEFWQSGVEKFHGENWFADIQDQFPFPFNVVPPEISWQISTWSELVGPVLLVLGLGTRFATVSLVILTIVAWASVHAGNGYNVGDNGYKLPLIYLIMFVPLLLSGPGKLSLDHWIARRLAPPNR